MKTRLIILTAILCLSIGARSQIVVTYSLYERNLYLAEVKQVDEFVERFNNDKFHISIDTTKAEYKENNLLALFNLENFKDASDSLLAETTMFIRTVTDSSVKLHYEDTLWFAKAPCYGKFKNKSVNFTLWLNVEHRSADMYKWVVAKAEGDIFKLPPSYTSDRIMISPGEHETNFMSLKLITTQKQDYITNYKQKNFDLDETSVFYSLVYYEMLSIDYVKDLEFWFFQVPGYVFRIKYFNRETHNSGWLIDKYEKISDEEKNEFLTNLYNQK